jgi:hypothetical protein
MTFHKLFHGHDQDLRVTIENDNGTVEVACTGCTCPKEALGYLCRERPGECGSWAEYRKYDPLTDVRSDR